MKLPNVPDLTVSKFGCILLRQRIQTHASEEHIPRSRTVQRPQDMEQSGLSSATLAHNRQHFTFTYPERQVVKEH